MWEDNYDYANDDGTNSYVNSDPLTQSSYDFDTGGSNWFNDITDYASQFYDAAPDMSALYPSDVNELYQNPLFDLGAQLAESGYIPTDDYGNPELSALLGNTDLAGAESFGDLSVGQLAGIAPWAEAGDYATAMALQDAEMAGAGLTPMMGNPGYYLDTNGNPVYAGDLQSGAVGNAQVAAPTFQTSESVVGGVAPVVDARGLRQPVMQGYDVAPDNVGLRASPVRDISGGLSVVETPNGLRTGSTSSMTPDSLGTGLLVDGAPDRPKSLDDLAILGDGGEEAWAKNADKTWQEYAAANPEYDQSRLSNVDLSRLMGKLPNITTGSPKEQGTLSKVVQALTGAKPAGTQGGTSGQQAQNGGGAGGAPMALTSALLQALGAMQNKGKAPAPTGGSQNAQAMRISRKAGSGRQNKASGGLLQMANGGRAAGGQDDVIPINAAPGEYVMDAETVSALGDGSTEAGAAKLDQMRHNVRQHKRTGALSKIPPKAKSVDKYMKGAR